MNEQIKRLIAEFSTEERRKRIIRMIKQLEDSLNERDKQIISIESYVQYYLDIDKGKISPEIVFIDENPDPIKNTLRENLRVYRENLKQQRAAE